MSSSSSPQAHKAPAGNAVYRLCTSMVFGGSRWTRMRRFAAMVIVMFLGFLVLNAMFVGYSLYRISQMSAKQVDLQMLAVEGLCDDTARVRIKVAIHDLFGLAVVGVDCDKATTVSVSFPAVHHAEVANVTVPAFSFGYGRNTLDFAREPVSVSVNEAYPFQKLLSLCTLSQQAVQVDFDIDMSLRTTSFIIPVMLARHFKISHQFSPRKDPPQASDQSKLASVEKIDFLSRPDSKDIDLEAWFRLSPQLVPGFLSVALPQIRFDVFKTGLGKGASAGHLATITSPPQSVSSQSPLVTAALNLSAKDRSTIVDSIKQAIQRDTSLAVGITSGLDAKSECKLQRALCRVSWQVPLGALLSGSAGATGVSGGARPPTQTAGRSPIAKVHFGASQHHFNTTNAINVRTVLDADYFRGLAGLGSTRFVGALPPVNLLLNLEHGFGPSATNSTLAMLSARQEGSEPTGHHGCFHLAMKLVDGDKLVKSVVRAVQFDRNRALLHPELRAFKRLLLTGTDDQTLMSAIVSLFELQYQFAGRLVHFTHHIAPDVVGSTANGVPDFAAPPALSGPARHSVKLSATQDAHMGTLQVDLDLQKTALTERPVVEVAWDRVDLGASAKDRHLFDVSVEPGSLMLSVAALRPALLAHNGRASVRVAVDGKLDDGINALVERLREGESFVPVSLNGQIGERDVAIDASIPPLSAVASVANVASAVSAANVASVADSPNQDPGRATSASQPRAHVRMVGMKGAAISMLLELGDRDVCPQPGSHHQSIIELQASLPDLSVNVCLFKANVNQGCMAAASVKRMHLAGTIVDSVLCGVQASMLPEELDDGDQEPPIQALIHQHTNSTTPKHWLPFSVNVYDYKKAFEALDSMYDEGPYKWSLAPGHWDGDKETRRLSWNRLLNSLSTVLTYRLNYPAISFGMEQRRRIQLLKDAAVRTEVEVWSESRSEMHGRIQVRVPEDALGTGDEQPRHHGGCSGYSFEWGPLELELKAGPEDWFRMSMSEGRVFVAHPLETCPRSTSTFSVHFAVHSGAKELTSGDLRRAIHHLVENHLNVEDGSVAHKMAIHERRLAMTARVGEFRSPKEFATLHSRLKLRTLVQLAHVCYAKYKHGKPSGVPLEWTTTLHLDALPQVSLNATAVDVVKLPCFFNTPCGDLIHEASSRSHLAKATLTVTGLVQRLMDISCNNIGRMVNKLALSKYLTKSAFSIKLHAPLRMALALNDNIDISEVVVPEMWVERESDIEYPGCSADDVLELRAKRILADRFEAVSYVQLPRYYHDATGLLAPFDMDPLWRFRVEPPPADFMHYSPLSITLSNERVEESNMLSSLGCVLIEKTATLPMPSTLGTGSGSASGSDSGSGSGGQMKITAPISNEQLLELNIRNILVPNPTWNMAVRFVRPILAEYEFKGRVFGRARIEPFHLAPGLTPIEVNAQLTKDCFGRCDKDSDAVKDDLGRFLAGTALGSSLEVTAVAHLAPGLSVSLHFKHPNRLVQLAVFDADATLAAFAEYGIRTVNALDPLMARGSRLLGWLTRWTEKTAGSAAQQVSGPEGSWREAIVGRLWQWWYGEAGEKGVPGPASDSDPNPAPEDPKTWRQWTADWWSFLWTRHGNDDDNGNGNDNGNDNSNTSTNTPPNTNSNHLPTTRGLSNYDLNIPICLRNDADLEMRLFGLYLNIAFDDTDGFYFSPDTERSPIRNTMFLAQQGCHPRRDVPFHRDSFLRCIREHPAGPASVLHARSSLAGRNVVMTPIPLSSKFVARVFDEAVNHDGPCLRITADSFISVGLSNGQGRDEQFTMNIPLDIMKDLEMNPFGDACGQKTECICRDSIRQIKPLRYIDCSAEHVGQEEVEEEVLQANDTFHLSHNRQVWMQDKLHLMASWEVEFTIEFTRSPSSFRASAGYPGLAFVLQQNGRNVTVGAGETLFGYSVMDSTGRGGRVQLSDVNVQQPLSKSIAVLFEPHTSDTRPLAQRTVSNIPYLGWKGAPPNAISVLQNGSSSILRVPNPKAIENEKEPKELLLKKVNGVFSPYDSVIRVRVVHSAAEKQLYVYCNGGSSASPPHYHSVFPLDLARLLPHAPDAWFGFTGQAEGRVQEWQVHSIRAATILPDIPRTRIFWQRGVQPALPHHPAMFYLQLRDECDRPMAMSPGRLVVELQLVDSQHPRAVVRVDDGEGRRGTRHPASSLLYNPQNYTVLTDAQFDAELRLYRVSYSAGRPGRYTIMARIAEHQAVGVQVQWHTILVLPYY